VCKFTVFCIGSEIFNELGCETEENHLGFCSILPGSEVILVIAFYKRFMPHAIAEACATAEAKAARG